MIPRIVTPKLTELLDEFPAVAVIGPRQVGKTTLVRALNASLGMNTLYIDLENPRDEVKLTDPVLFFERNTDRCVVLDEIQRRGDLFPVLRSMIDLERRPARFILLGSASPELIRGSSESLAGRIYYVELHPLCVLEIDQDASAIDQLLIRGGYPNSYLAASDAASLRWREGFVQTYVERDLSLLGLPLGPSEARRLLRMAAHIHGQQLNIAAVSRSLGVSAPTAKKYLEFLQQAFLVDILEPYSGNTGKRLSKSPKLYFRDSGMLNYFLGIRNYDDLLGHPQAGAIWEGFVMQQIRAVLEPEIDLCFYRSSHGNEIDAVLTHPDRRRIGVEIKFGSSPSLTRGSHEAMRDLNLDRLFVIIPGQENYPLREGLDVIGVPGFIECLVDWQLGV
jgi:predicted AAA+ superfamily ATPase